MSSWKCRSKRFSTTSWSGSASRLDSNSTLKDVAANQDVVSSWKLKTYALTTLWNNKQNPLMSAAPSCSKKGSRLNQTRGFSLTEKPEAG